MARQRRVRAHRRGVEGDARGPCRRALWTRRKALGGGLLSLHRAVARAGDLLSGRLARGARLWRHPLGGARKVRARAPARLGIWARARKACDDPLLDPGHPPLLDGGHALHLAVCQRRGCQVPALLKVPRVLQGRGLLCAGDVGGERLHGALPRVRRRPDGERQDDRRVYQPKERQALALLPHRLPQHGPLAHQRGGRRDPVPAAREGRAQARRRAALSACRRAHRRAWALRQPFS
mmetsp:Transcript_10508/g.33134  ORF Transcript_10508/g.33134 Transcript_10508/m.33134 type:complete len:236 (+) Transcript_10508:626-1333(+)